MLLILILLKYKVLNLECRIQRTINVYDNSNSFENHQNLDILLSINTTGFNECNKIKFYDNNNLLDYWIENKCNLYNTLVWINLNNFYKTKQIKMIYDCNVDIVTEKQFDGEIYFFTKNNDVPLQQFDGKFLFGSEVFGSVHEQQNVDSHDHVISGTNCTSDELKREIMSSNKKFSNYKHSHDWNFISEPSSTNTPPFYGINMLSRNKLFINKTDNPVIMFETIIDSNKFTRFTGLDNRLPKVGTSNQIGGSFEHFHFINGNLETSKFLEKSGDNNGDICSNKHSHSHNVFGRSENASNYPPFVSVLFGSYTGLEDYINITNSMIFVASKVPPLGYEICSNFVGRFPKGDEVYGIQGGSFAHQHEYYNVIIEPEISSYQECVIDSSGLHVSVSNHTHFDFVGTTLTVHTNPTYIEVLFIKRKDHKLEEYYYDITTEPQQPTQTEQFNIIYMLAIIVSIVILSLFYILITLLIIASICFCKIIHPQKRDNGIELLKEDDEEPKFEINKELFKIKPTEVNMIEEIGSGGSGCVVYRSNWNGIIVAYKVFKRKTILNKEEDYKTFEKEIKILSSVSHPSIAVFYGCVISKKRLGIVMEYCGKGHLKKYIKISKRYPQSHHQLDMNEKLRILIEISLGGHYLHQRNIIHRDLKCENVLLNDKLNAKIIDFGISKIDTLRKMEHMTRAIGTRHYMAPEVIRGERYSVLCDVFSFSIIMYELLTECFTPYATSIEGRRCQSIEFNVSTDSNFRPDIDPKGFPNFGWYVGLMKSCWEEQPSKRPSFLEIIKIIKKNRKT